MKPAVLMFVTVAAVLSPVSGKADSPGRPATEPERGTEPGGTKTNPETTVRRKQGNERDWAPASVGGFTVGHRRMGIQVELGYPFARLEVSYGLGSHFQLFAGYQGMYSYTSAGYAGIKLGLIATPKRDFGLAVAALGGYTRLRLADEPLFAAMAGGDGAFGEFRLSLSGRRRRHGFFVNAGMRMSQVTAGIRCQEGGKPESMARFNCLTDDPVLTTVFLEAGYEARISLNASYFVGLGADVFSGAWYPAMVRFRTGLLFDF